MNPSQSAPRPHRRGWRSLGLTGLRLAVAASGATLTATGRLLLVCGRQVQVLGARLRPQ